MTVVYLIRHSRKLAAPIGGMDALFDRIQPLTVLGEELARRLTDVEELRHADIAYSSPAARTISTLRYIIEADDIPYSLDERLRELEFGRMPPPPKEGVRPAPDSIMVRQWSDHDLAAEGGESVRQCRARMTEVITEIVRKNPDKKILIGSHGAAIASYLSGIMEGVNDDFTRGLTQPDIFRISFDGDTAVNITHITAPGTENL